MIDEDEAEVVREIYRLITSEGYGTNRVASHLNKQGIKTKRVRRSGTVPASERSSETRSTKVYLRFEGLDDFQVEVWFSGDLEYDASRMDVGCSTWCDCTLILHDGFIYFADWYDLTIDNITSEPNYFKARHMKYRIIPD